MTDPAPSTVTVAIASDHAGYPLKQALVALASDFGVTFDDLGTHSTASTDYPDYAHQLAARITSGTHSLGILVCGTGIGMSMAANRHTGIRAALCHTELEARMTRRHNDANVLCLGARVIGVGQAEAVVAAFLADAFEGGRHARRVDKIEPGDA